MPSRSLITGQHVDKARLARAQEFRRRLTPAESKLWQRLQADRLEGFHFRRQQVIDRFIVDFYCHQASLVVEVDGGVHLDQTEYDHERDLYLKSRGLHILRFTNTEISNNLESVLSAILAACREAFIA